MQTKYVAKLALLLALVWLLGCSKDDGRDNDQVLVKSKLVVSYSQGELINLVNLAATTYPQLSAFVPKITAGANVYYIEYNTDYKGKKVVASGYVAVPAEAPQGGSMLLSFQNGTIVLHSEAPTQSMTEVNMVVLHAIAGMGITVCVADNLGFGASDELTHPYLNKKLFQSSNINLIKAVKEMELKASTSLKLNGDLFFMGYSLGGWASLVAHKYVEDNGIDGFNLVGSACGAGSYNLVEMKEYLFAQTDYIQPYYLPLLLWGFASTGDIESKMSLFFREPYASCIPSLYDGLHSSADINAQLTGNIPQLMAADLIASPTLSKFDKLNAALANNSQSAWKNSKPIHFYHGTADVHVPYSISANLVDAFRELGQDESLIQFTSLEGANHRTGSMPMFIAVLGGLLGVGE